MKITKFLTFAMALGVLFTSCNKDEVDGFATLPPAAGGEGRLSVSLIDGTGLLTKAVTSAPSEAGTEEEREIKSLAFYVYDADGIYDSSFTPATVGGNSYTFGVGTGSLTVVALANMTVTDTLTFEALEKDIYNQQIATPTAIPSTGIPMSGVKTGVEVASGETGVAVVSVARLFARFNAPTINENLEVNITTPAEVDTLKVLFDELGIVIDETTQLDFDFGGYVVINGLKKSYVLPNYGTDESNRWNSDVWKLGNDLDNYTASVYEANGAFPANGARVYSGEDFLNNTNVYLYENCSVYLTSEDTETGIAGFDRASAYSMIVKGDLYVVGHDSVKKTRYWRINVSKTEDAKDYFKILRNAIYKIDIENVVTAGYNTPEEAEEGGGGEIPGPGNGALQVKVDVLDWKVFNENTDI
ncbi:MAG: fimbrial protein [Tannerellaceae bacterium]|nr:fimbrial protein [Tannerellaceae bacterium]